MFKLGNYYSIDELSVQYKRQSKWSAKVLEYYWPKKIPEITLDVGCGPSPVYFQKLLSKNIVGVDIEYSSLKRIPSNIFKVQANSVNLPFRDNIFDVVICHYLLLWAPMKQTLKEMWRVTTTGGRLICASEPDYSNRIEEPNCIKDDFVEAIKSLGADPSIGGQLENELSLLTDNFETGILTQNMEKKFQLNELKNDINFLSRVLKKDLIDQVMPLVTALTKGFGNIYMPVHYGCAFK